MPNKYPRQAMPNHLLRRARQERGWSQQELAVQIGAPQAFLITRWERGTAFPSPYYRQKLCDLFGKKAAALGLIQQEPTIAPSGNGVSIYDPAIPLPLAETHALVGRDELLAQLKQDIIARESVVLTALNGIPGVGKTALAAALANDADVQQYFHDGILWSGLGPGPNVIELLSRWGRLLGMSEAEMADLRTRDAWMMAIHGLIGKRQMLLVIDDAWNIEDALAFKLGGTQCAHVLTTRQPEVATRFAGEQARQVRELNLDEGLQLLTQLAPSATRAEPEEARTLVLAVGGLPLALTLMGNYLSVETRHQQRRRIHAALTRLQQVEERLKLEQPQGGLEQHASLPKATPLSLQAVIGTSEHFLDDNALQALYALSVFPAKPNTFSEEAALAVAVTTPETLDRLVDVGLVESSGPDRYTLHQTIADYAGIARAKLADATVCQRLVDYMVGFVQAHETDYEMLEPEGTNILAALQIAFERKLLVELVQGVCAFVRFLQVRGVYEVAEEQLQRANQAATLLGDQSAIVTALLYQGQVAEGRGNYRQAENFLQQGLLLARQLDDRQRACQMLTNLGTVERKRGNYAQAWAFLDEGLVLARQIGHLTLLSQLLANLGALAGEQGNNDQAEVYLEEGLALARHIGDREHICWLLSNLGSVMGQQGKYAQAEVYLQESLVLARQIGQRTRTCFLLLNLGAIAGVLDNYAQTEFYLQEGLGIARQINHRELMSLFLSNLGVNARAQEHDIQSQAYLQEALELARQIGHSWLISTILGDWGELQLKQKQFDAASLTFHEMLESTPEGNQELYATAQYGLARIAAIQGNLPEAHHLGKMSLEIFEAISHNLLPEVKSWLDTLPPPLQPPRAQ